LSGWSTLGAYTASLGIAVVLACKSPTSPLPAGAVSFAAPPEYELWWRMTETCAGRQGKFEQVSWYIMPGVPTVTTPAGEGAQGYWDERAKRIVLAGFSQHEGWLVRHEMLHALLGAVPGHPHDDFLLRCGGIVVCADDCLEGVTADPANHNSYAVVPPESLEVSASLTPTTPSSTSYDGHFALIVSVTNKRAFPVFVSSRTGLGFGYRIQAPSGWAHGSGGSGDPQAATFLAGQTKVLAFDLVLNSGWPAPGTFDVWPEFGGYEGKTPLRFTVDP
jgi:hypothetical protein